MGWVGGVQGGGMDRESCSLSSPEDPTWEAEKGRPEASAEPEGKPELTWCPTVFLCSLAV